MKKLVVLMSIACLLLTGALSAQTAAEKPKEGAATTEKAKKDKDKKDKDAKKAEEAAKPKH